MLHIIEEICWKGTTDNTSTCSGEEFQQEAAEAYMQTNKKWAEKQVHHYFLLTLGTLLFRFGAQMVRIDENQEAIAFIQMAIDNNAKAQDQSDTKGHEVDLSRQYWTFGSPNGTQLDSRELERVLAPSDRNFTSFNNFLRLFIAQSFPDETLCYEDLIYVTWFHSIQSLSFHLT